MGGMIRKALIPTGGLGTRLGPIGRVLPKAMLPLVDGRDRVRPVVHYLLSDARSAGANEAAIIVSPDGGDLIRRYLAATASDDELPERIEYIIQPSPRGFGDAVLCGREFVGDEEFILFLGDHVCLACPWAEPIAAQTTGAYEETGGVAMIGMQPVGLEELPRVGVASGDVVGDRTYRCRCFVEKPDATEARRRLRTDGLGEEQFLAHCGVYVFTPEIFEHLDRLRRADRPAGEEIQLADAQSALLADHREDYYLYRIAGRAHDVGTPAGYATALEAFRSATP